MKYICFIFFLLIIIEARSQTSGSITYYFKPDTEQKIAIDTTLNQVQRYNPNFYGNNFYAWNGAIGLPSYNLYFKPDNVIGFDLGRKAFNMSSIINDSVNYYHTRRAHSEVSALLSLQKKEQYISLFHTQNITKRWNTGFKFFRTQSQGYAFKQQTSNSNFVLFTSYQGVRYEIFANYIRNYSLIQENGGVSDSAFIDAAFSDKKLVPVNLSDASNRRKNNNFNVLHKYKFFNVSNDSVTDYLLEAGHAFTLNNISTGYSDLSVTNKAYYDHFYYDTLRVNDSVRVQTLSNELFIATRRQNNRPFYLKFGFENQQIAYQFLRYVVRNPLETYFVPIVAGNKSNNIIKLNGSYRVSENALAYARINYAAGGMVKSDRLIVLGGNFSLRGDSIKSPHTFNVEVAQNLKHPDFYKTNYFSNTIFYAQNLKQQLYNSVVLNYFHTKWKLLLRPQFVSVSNYVYYDSTYMPKQLNRKVNVVSVLLNKDLGTRHFVLSSNVLFQNSSAVEVPLPELYIRESVYYKGRLFKNALDCQVGFDVNYFTGYNAYGYYAPTAQYYVQDQKQVGSYPYCDFFLNARIANARVFLKVDHFNSGLLGNEYFNLLNYPLPDRNIKFGVTWMLLN